MDLSFRYVIVVDPPAGPERQTPTSMFSEHLLKLPATTALTLLSAAPGDYLELTASRQAIIERKHAGGTACALVMVSSTQLDDSRHRNSKFQPFIVYVPTGDTGPAVEAWAAQNPYPSLVLPQPGEGDARAWLSSGLRRKLWNYAQAVLKELPADDPDVKPDLGWLLGQKGPTVLLPELVHYHHGGHLGSQPNLVQLWGLGYSAKTFAPFLAEHDADYYRMFADAARAVLRLRERVPRTESPLNVPRTSLVLYAQAHVRRLHRHGWGFRRVKSDEDRAHARLMARATKMYFSRSTFSMREEETQARAILNDPIAAGMLALVRHEAHLYSGLVTKLAAPNLAPVLRCPPMVHDTHSQLDSLVRASDGLGPRRRWKASKIARELGTHLAERALTPYSEFLGKPQDHIKIVSDVPLELAHVNHLPLSLRFSTSRLPSTPGNVLARSVLMRDEEIRLSPRDLKSVLLIRLLDPKDFLYPLLEDTLRSVIDQEQLDVALTVANVRNPDELTQALLEFSGAVAIIDGHGRHTDDPDVGTIKFGSTWYSLWETEIKAPIPPIVVLSACGTARPDRSALTVANLFLSLGARSVLGTLTKINGAYSALLTARLVQRMHQHLPAVLESRLMRWSELTTGLLWASYATDVIVALAKSGDRRFSALRTYDGFVAAQFAANLIIDRAAPGLNPAWFDEFLVELAKQTEVQPEAVRSAWSGCGYWSESLKYVQFGLPEQILFVPDRLAEALRSE